VELRGASYRTRHLKAVHRSPSSEVVRISGNQRSDFPEPTIGGRGNQLGLELCSPDVGPHLRLEYTDQPSGERLYVAMKPITGSDGEPRIFVVAHDSVGLSLDAARARSDDKWSPDDIFVFCLVQSTSHDNS